jgi:hypothetical protein
VGGGGGPCRPVKTLLASATESFFHEEQIGMDRAAYIGLMEMPRPGIDREHDTRLT